MRGVAESRIGDMDDRSLIEAAREGSPEALDQVFARCWPIMWRAAAAILDEGHSAEDAAQDALLKLVGALDRFQSGGSLEPWARRIAVNTALDARRARLSRNGAASRLQQAATPSPLDEESEAPMPGAVVDAVRTLTEDRRVVVALHYWLDLGVDEIAAILEIPRGTVMSRLRRAVD